MKQITAKVTEIRLDQDTSKIRDPETGDIAYVYYHGLLRHRMDATDTKTGEVMLNLPVPEGCGAGSTVRITVDTTPTSEPAEDSEAGDIERHWMHR